jgi:alcohol dehydrogenase
MNNHNDIKDFLSKKKFKKCLLISGKNSYYVSGANKIFDNLLDKLNCFKYFKKNLIPEFSELKEIIKIVHDFKPDLILAIGGGTVIDYAKSANCLNKEILPGEIISGKISYNKKAKLCAIPTTAGSGAEVTENAVLYIKEIKYSVEDKLIKPDYFFLMPELIIDTDFKLKATSGFDAIAQGIESILSIKSNDSSFIYSEKSLSYSFSNFEKYLKNPNMENTNGMCLAANLSGKAISIARTTAPHALSYPFTSIFNVSHGHAVSLTLNEFIKFNFLNMNRAKNNFDLKKRYEILFRVSKTNSINELCDYLNFLKKTANLEGRLKKLNIHLDSNYEQILSGVNLLRLKNNPVEITHDDIKKILDKINK